MSETKISAGEFQNLSQKPDNCVLEGFHAIKHAIRFGAELKCVIGISRDDAIRLARDLAPDVATSLAELVEDWPQSAWRKLGLDIPTGIVAVARKKAYHLEDIDQKKLIVFLEEPRNLGNVGAVIRVAAAADAGGVVMSGTIDPWSPAVIRGAAGLQFALPVVSTANIIESDRPIYALDPDGARLEEVTIPSDAILAFGTERGGLTDTLLKRAKHRVAIPMRENVSSLNLATSVAVALYIQKINRQS